MACGSAFGGEENDRRVRMVCNGSVGSQLSIQPGVGVNAPGTETVEVS